MHGFGHCLFAFFLLTAFARVKMAVKADQSFQLNLRAFGAPTMPAAFWSAVHELHHRFERTGSTHQERLDNIIASLRSHTPSIQRGNFSTLTDVSDNTTQLRSLLVAALPPEIISGQGN